jgi:hypothetical protein
MERRMRLLGVEVVQEPCGAAIRQEWSRSMGFAVLLTFGFFSLFFLVVEIASGIFRSFAPVVAGDSGWIVVAVLCPFVFALLIALYVAVCNIRNVATWRVEDGRLTVRHGPLPLKRGRSWAVADIDELLVREIEDKDSDGDPYTYFRLVLRTRDGREVSLVRKLESLEQGRALEQVLEERLRIGKRPAQGKSER